MTILVGEGEAHPANCMQRENHVGLFSPSTQAARNGVKVSVVKVMNVGAHGFDERLPPDGLAALTEQTAQEALFRGGQAETMAHAIGKHPATFHQGPSGGWGWRRVAVSAEALIERNHRGGQFPNIDGFDEVSVCTPFETIDPVVYGTPGRRHDDPNRLRGPQMGSYGQTVLAVQANVENDDVGRLGSVGSVEGCSAVKPMYVQPQPGEAKDHFLAKIRVIIDKINEGSDRVTALFRHFTAHQRHPPVQRLQGIKLHLIIALCILFGGLAAQTSWALPLDPADGVNAPVSLSGHLAVLHDPSGALTLDDILSGHSNIPFEPIPSMLTEGYRKGAIWVRFSLSAPETSNRWLLQVERPLIEHVTVYVRDGTGRFAILPPTDLSGDEDVTLAYATLFSIPASSAETEYYIRFQSMTSITTALNIWQKDGYAEYRRSDNWIMSIVLGAVGAMIIANLLYAYLLRDSLYLLYAALLIESAMMTIFHLGYADQVFYTINSSNIHRIWGTVVCLYSIVMVWFLAKIFEFRRHWIWSWRIIECIILLNGVALIFSIAGHYGDVGLFVSRLQQLSYLFIAAFVLYLLIALRQQQYLLSALAFACVIAVSLVMQSQYAGTNLFGIDTSLARFMAIGTLIHLVLLSAAVAQRARFAELSLSEEKDRVIAVSRVAERELATKVRERTAELADRNASLKAEVDRRHLLELKLRQSLDAVNDALAQQRDFVALVSHEFRGPLAVIAAAADNLSSGESTDNTKLRTARIRQTVKRMSLLIENVLAGDRLNGDQKAFPMIGMVHLNEILRTAKAGLDDDAARRVSFILCDEVTVKGDRNLLEIAVQNLIQNAMKYSAAPSPVTVRLSTNQGVAFVHVMDQGIGVAPNDRELIFMKYYRAAGQSANGSGLGLYISREIAQQHGGDLTLVASGGNGSTFCLSLPIKGAEPLTA